MVCPKCEKKLAKLGAPDVHGKNPVDDKSSKGPAPKGVGTASGSASGSSATHTASGRMLNENKALSSKKNRFQPYAKFLSCKVCKVKTHHPHAHYCSGCAYKIGICCMCGKQIVSDEKLKTSRQSST